MVTWPTEYGGRGLDLIEWLIFEEEYYRAEAPTRVNQNGVFLLGPTLMEFGTHEQKSKFLNAMATGDHIWAQGWSEPGAGSDMAAIRTTAVLEDGCYKINGQKTWSSRATYADWTFGLFRTDLDSERHRGLSFILVPLNLPGITVRPIAQLDGEPGFAEIYFDDVTVPAENLLGGDGEGWKIAMATAGFERGLMLRSPARFQQTAAKLLQLYLDNESDCSPAMQANIVEAWAQSESYALSIYHTASKMLAGGSIGSESSLGKIFWSELDHMMHQTALKILGASAELSLASKHDSAKWIKGFMFSYAGPIYAGTNEIQKNIIAERLLGLPK
jgi:alkylation response protein AidB-like acyl-CoA dehydrogenase